MGTSSGACDQTSHQLGLLLLDTPNGHGQHHGQGQATLHGHFSFSADGVLLEAKADIQTAVHAFDRCPKIIFAIEFVAAAINRGEDAGICGQRNPDPALVRTEPVTPVFSESATGLNPLAFSQ